MATLLPHGNDMHQASPIETGVAANKQPVLVQGLGRAVGKDLLQALPGSQRALGMVFLVLENLGDVGVGDAQSQDAGCCRIHPHQLTAHPTMQNQPHEDGTEPSGPFMSQE